MKKRLAGTSRWLAVAALILLGAILFRYSAFRQHQVESLISGRQYHPPDHSSRVVDSNAEQQAHSLETVLEMARQLKARMEEELLDYTATIIKRERINGKLGDEDFMKVKIRHARPQADPPIPFSVYLIYIAPSKAEGREVIWVKGRNEDKLLTHQFGLRFSLPPDGFLAMMGNRYPITEIGMLNLAEKLIEKGERDRDQPGCNVELFENQLVGDRLCQLIQVQHPQPLPGLDYHLAQIFIDNQWKLPIRYAAYSWPAREGESPVLEEEYTYIDLQINPGLTDEDFDPKNPEYKFPK